MENRKKIFKIFFVWQFEKEELWLNNMAANGWILDKVGFLNYTFVQNDLETYTIRLEMRSKDDAYIDFMKETGAELVGSMMQWLYFRKKATAGEFNIFSDLDSKIGHLDRIGKVVSVIGFANLVIGLVNSISIHSSAGWLNLLCATLLMYGLGRIHGKKESLLKTRLLQE